LYRQEGHLLERQCRWMRCSGDTSAIAEDVLGERARLQS
jgi:hypothetical protein